MEPLDTFTKLQPLIDHEIDQKLEAFASNRQYDVAKIPDHTHTGTDANRVDFGDLINRKRFILYRIVSPTIDTAVGNIVGGDFNMPFGGYIYEVGATVDTAGSTNATTIDVNKNGATIMLTKITIDSTEKTSRTAATAPVVSSSKVNFLVGDIFTFDIDGVSTTPAKGLTIYMDVIQTTP